MQRRRLLQKVKSIKCSKDCSLAVPDHNKKKKDKALSLAGRCLLNRMYQRKIATIKYLCYTYKDFLQQKMSKI